MLNRVLGNYRNTMFEVWGIVAGETWYFYSRLHWAMHRKLIGLRARF